MICSRKTFISVLAARDRFRFALGSAGDVVCPSRSRRSAKKVPEFIRKLGQSLRRTGMDSQRRREAGLLGTQGFGHRHAGLFQAFNSLGNFPELRLSFRDAQVVRAARVQLVDDLGAQRDQQAGFLT
jgi:hypothetical protein